MSSNPEYLRIGELQSILEKFCHGVGPYQAKQTYGYPFAKDREEAYADWSRIQHYEIRFIRDMRQFGDFSGYSTFLHQ
jgi:hypothetical protein